MGKHDRCCVGGCDNDKRYLHLCVKRRHVEGDLVWHRFPKDPKKFEIWRKILSEDSNSLTLDMKPLFVLITLLMESQR